MEKILSHTLNSMASKLTGL